MSTNSFSVKNIKRDWVLIDAKDQILGRLAVEVAKILRGKNKPSFVPYLDQGDFVVVINVKNIKVTGKKESQKVYHRHSGYPGGLKSETLSNLRDRRPTEVLRHAVRGMLPKNKLGERMIKKLYLFADENHNMDRQLGIKNSELRVESEEKVEGAQAILA